MKRVLRTVVLALSLVALAAGRGPAAGEKPPGARQEGLTPYALFWAQWCPTRKELVRNFDHPRVKEALVGTYIVMLNVDSVGRGLRGSGFAPPAIPTFYALAGDGRPTGRKMVGVGNSTRGESMARALARFFDHR